MALMLVGDVQGCDAALAQWLERADFSPSRDRLVLLGDLINRGPQSLQVLRRLRDLDGAGEAILGNHDLHALAMWRGHASAKRLDTLEALLGAPEVNSLMQWLCLQPLARRQWGVLMVHAGLLPQWSGDDSLRLAAEFQPQLEPSNIDDFLRQMYGNEPAAWHEDLQGLPRWRVIVNALTRLRFCSAEGVMEFATKESASQAPAGFMPWFDVPGRRSAGEVIAFGHWSTLGSLDRPDLWALDTGCVWGGCLSGLRIEGPGQRPERLTVRCAAAQKPGA